MEILWIASIAIFSSVTAPLMLVLISNRQRRAEKHEDWERQDAIADRLKAHNDVVTGELHEIKTLVNGNLTEAMHGECEATVAQLAVMHEMAALARANGVGPSPQLEAEIAEVEKRAERLRDACALRPYDRPVAVSERRKQRSPVTIERRDPP